MTVLTEAQSQTWTYVDGDWHEGNVPLIGPRSHAMWLGSSVFDGARWFEHVAPDLDLHCARVNASAEALGLKPTMSAEAMLGLAEEVRRRDRRLCQADVLGRAWRLYVGAGRSRLDAFLPVSL
jgi:branched-subunit amino acid aminotransferase/4-amino-4-deoxychorismate lyase